MGNMATQFLHFPKRVATRRSDQPAPGYFVLRLVKNVPWVGGQIVQENGQRRAKIGGEWEGPSANSWCLYKLVRWHHYEVFSTESEFKFHTGQRRWAEMHSPNQKAVKPMRPMNLDEVV